MNDIMALTNAVQEQEYRQSIIDTEEGKAQLRKGVLEIMTAFEAMGYHMPKADVDMTATLWAHELRECFVDYGMSAIKKAVLTYAKEDESEFHHFPSVGRIIAEVKVNNYNAKIKLARWEYEMRVQEIEKRHEEELIKNASPEILEKLEAMSEDISPHDLLAEVVSHIKNGK